MSTRQDRTETTYGVALQQLRNSGVLPHVGRPDCKCGAERNDNKRRRYRKLSRTYPTIERTPSLFSLSTGSSSCESSESESESSSSDSSFGCCGGCTGMNEREMPFVPSAPMTCEHCQLSPTSNSPFSLRGRLLSSSQTSGAVPVSH